MNATETIYAVRTAAGLCVVTEVDGAVVTASLVADEAMAEGLTIYDDFPTLAVRPVGTPFQQNVWRHLCHVCSGERITYGELARRCGCPTAVRAVATAVGRNPIAVLIPCHRIVPAAGGIGNYFYGSARKRQLLEAERAGRGTCTAKP